MVRGAGVGGMLCMLLLAGGCGGQRGGVPGQFKPIDPTAAVFWDRQTTESAELLRTLANEFNASRPGRLPIKVEHSGGYKEIFQKVSASIRAGALPGMAVAYQSMTAEYAQTGAVVALDSGPSSVAREPDAYWSLALPYGLHSVTASLPGFRSASRSCPVTSGESAYCSLGLVPEGSGAGSLPAAPSTDPALVADPTPAIAPAADQIPQARPANSGCASAGSSDAPLASGLMLLLFSLFRRFLRTPQDNKVSLKK